jgi:hypothetical protein
VSPPDRSYAAEPDPEFPGQQAIVVRLSSDPDENGMVTGWVTGPAAMTHAMTAAQVMSQTGRPLSPGACAQLGYTPKEDVPW